MADVAYCYGYGSRKHIVKQVQNLREVEAFCGAWFTSEEQQERLTKMWATPKGSDVIMDRYRAMPVCKSCERAKAKAGD